MAPSHSLVRPYYACESRIRYVSRWKGGYFEKFVWAVITMLMHSAQCAVRHVMLHRLQAARPAHRSYTRYSCRQLYGESEHFTAKIEVASQLRDKVLEVPCGATRRVSRAFGRRPHRRISATKSAGSGILYRHFEWWL